MKEPKKSRLSKKMQLKNAKKVPALIYEPAPVQIFSEANLIKCTKI
jgi:hypothetical protein